MRTLHTGPFLACMLLRYDHVMTKSFKQFLQRVILRVDRESEIKKNHADMFANTLCDIQDEGDFGDETLEEFLELIERHEVNVRKPHSIRG